MPFIIPDSPPEPGYPQFVSKYVRTTDTVVEVGGGIGGGTTILSQLAKSVVSFEPSPSNFKVLRHKTRKMRNVKTYNLGVGAKRSKAVLHVMDRNGVSGVKSQANLVGMQFSGDESVDIVSLDDFKLPIQPTVLILDCEGAEIGVLTGATQLLKGLNTVLVETHVLDTGNTEQSVMDSLASNRFENVFVEKLPNDTWVVARK